MRFSPILKVALRKESVDRNIGRLLVCCFVTLVALRKESVDRNSASLILPLSGAVALRKESVDRKAGVLFLIDEIQRRSPQGERG